MALGKARSRPPEDTDEEWSPSSGNDSHISTPIKPKMESPDVIKSASTIVWCIEDEIAILQAHLNYSSLKNAKPSSDYAAFLTFVEDRLQIKPNKIQLRDKFLRLRVKYKKILAKRSFPNPHEEKLFKLSKRIWGQLQGDKAVKNKVIDDGVVVNINKTGEKNIIVGGMCGDLVLSGGSAADLEDWFRRNPGQLISNKDRTEMLEKSQCLKIAKARQYLAEIQLMEEQTKVAAGALKAILT
ncbi:hypothetical protein HAX54_027907 [Datura stramonium]|uniref:Glabrous enhancer-binding protein-like DBD domain-containing protein n=1 Tax=Datura stramonium TaxID=4076 RepID=A0ABS8V447_DATST|nr:hypothetical protein [Datura stramonium]